MSSREYTQVRQSIIKQTIKYLEERGVEVSFDELDEYIPKTQPKIKRKKFTYKRFVKICEENRLEYFPFNDENKWSGPAIKIPTESLDYNLRLFNKKDIHILQSSDKSFVFIRPLKKEFDNIVYKQPIFDESTEESSNEDDDGDDEDCEWEKWKYNGAEYWLDKKNIMYCIQTEEPVGKKIDNYSAEFY